MKKIICKFFLYLLTIFIFIILFLLVRKFIVFKSLSNKLNAYTLLENYYIKEIYYCGDTYTVTETWVKNSNMYKKYISDNYYHYIYTQDNEWYEYDNITQTQKPSTGNLSTKNNWNFILSISKKLNNLKSIFMYTLKERYINGKVCYQICIEDGDILYLDKETALLVRYETNIGTINSDKTIQSALNDYFFEFNNVTDSDLQVNI